MILNQISDHLHESAEGLYENRKERTFYNSEQEHMYNTLQKQIDKAASYAELLIKTENEKGW